MRDQITDDVKHRPLPHHPNRRQLREFLKSKKAEIQALISERPGFHTGYEILFLPENEANLAAVKKDYGEKWPLAQQPDAKDLFAVEDRLLMVPCCAYDECDKQNGDLRLFCVYVDVRKRLIEEGGYVVILDTGTDRQVFSV